MSGQQTGDLIENGKNLRTVLRLDLHHIVPVKLQNISLFQIRLSKVPASFQKCHKAHGHATHQHVLFEQQHGFVVETSVQRLLFLETGADILYQRLFFQCPAKLLKIHRIHLDVPFLRGNHNILHILLDGNKGAGFHKIISAICYQILDGFPGLGEQLDFIKDDDAFPLVKLHTIMDRQQHIEGIQIIQMQIKIFFHSIGGSDKIDENIAFVFVLCKFFYDSRFTYPTGTLHQQSLLSLGFFLPCQELAVNLSFENHFHHLCPNINTETGNPQL